MDQIDELKARIQRAMLQDRFALRRGLRRAVDSRNKGQPTHKDLATLKERALASAQRRQQREANLPQVNFDVDLPIIEHRDVIAAAIREHQVVVVAGETGSGKSTQLPKICLDAGFGVAGMIGHTQPRRIAARSIAARVAEELRRPLGTDVGFKIRFDDRTNPQTYIKLMTDGVLLAETQTDRFLEQYEVIILDEAHERSLNVDFLIGLLRQLLVKRRELRLIITSATIDAERFAEHFSSSECPVPVIEVSGRTYPVEVRYRPLELVEGETQDVTEAIVSAVHELAEIDRGDMLVFLPTERDIRETAKRLRAERLRGDGQHKTEVLPLYARLSTAEQNRIFQPGPHRRIVLATNVAESSLTVPRIHYVIDTGTARISRYSPRLRVQRLPIEAVSQASADQRKGRCGRIASGICIRLYDEVEFQSRDRYTTPEIRRTNLAAVILQAKSLRLGEIDQIPFLDPPRLEAVRDGYKTLFEIGAVDHHRNLTDVGSKLARLPVDPRIARMILAADELGCLGEILIIAAALEVQDPRLRPADRQQAADQQHAKFLDDGSDFVSFLKLWDFYQDLKQSLSHSKLRKACQQNFLSHSRLREWSDIHRQLRQLAIEHKLQPHAREDDMAAIHQALLTGFLSGVAYLSGDHEYTGAGGTKFHLWPGSGLFQTKPKWIVAAEVVETTRRYGRTVARINPNWLEPLAEHLVKRSYSDPHWHRKSATVMAFEKVTLFGLPIVPRRRVPYGRIDPEVSRQMFIEQGLVQQQLDANDGFLAHNQSVLEQIAELAAKTRDRRYILDEYTLYSFYDERLPPEVVDLSTLRRWLKAAVKESPDILLMSEADLVPVDGSAHQEPAFPESLPIGSMNLPLRYQFQPGEDDDGVTVTVPVEGVGQLDAERMGWLVPGLLEEKVLVLIRSLPKAIRRSLVPAPDTAKRVASELSFGEGPFLATVAAKLGEIAQERISPQDFRLEKLPDHLRLNVQVIDEQGEVKAAGRDLAEVRRQLGDTSAHVHAEIEDGTWNRDGVSTWDFGDLPEQVRVSRGGIEVAVFPTVIDAGESVVKWTHYQLNPILAEKVLQLYDSKNTRHGNMLVGDTWSGKSTCWKVLQGALNRLKKKSSKKYFGAKIYVINPKSISINELFGSYNLANEWADGIFTTELKNALNDTKVEEKWLILDGPVDTLWIESMNSLLDDNKILTLITGDRIALTESMGLIFEVENLSVASPATVSRCGMIYLDASDLGWRPYVESWISKKQDEDVRSNLESLVDKYVKKVLDVKKASCKDVIKVVKIPQWHLCAIYSTPLQHSRRKAQGEMRKRKALKTTGLSSRNALSTPFSGQWEESLKKSIAGKLTSLSETLTQYSPSAPSMTLALTSKKATGFFSRRRVPDSWKLEETAYYSIQVTTVDTLRMGKLCEKLFQAKRNILLVGNTGVGKTALVQGLLKIVNETIYYHFSLIFSAQTSSNKTQEIIESHFERRGKNKLLPPYGRKALVFVDDLNMPRKDLYGSQPPLELLRQWMDYGGSSKQTQENIQIHRGHADDFSHGAPRRR